MRSLTRSWIAFVLAGGLLLAACGGDDADASPPGNTGDGSPQIEGSVSDDDLLVPRAYLQGEWCDSDGDMWTIEGDTAKLEDGSGGMAELPVDLVFIDDLDADLVSQTDNEFVISSGGDEISFTRGSC